MYNLARVIYNLYFHPLSRFPGPASRAAFAWFEHWPLLKGTHVHDETALHEKYGSVVRIGPNALSFSGGSAWKGKRFRLITSLLIQKTSTVHDRAKTSFRKTPSFMSSKRTLPRISLVIQFLLSVYQAAESTSCGRPKSCSHEEASLTCLFGSSAS